MRIAITATLLCLAVLAACSNTADSRRILDVQGYTDIEILGYAFDTCGPATMNVTAFKATSPAGHPVEGVVCESLYGSHAVQLR